MRKNLKQLLILSFSLVILVPLLVIGISVFKIVAEKQEKQITEKNLALAKALSSEIEMFIENPKSILKRLHHVLDQETIIKEKSIHLYLEAIIQSFPFFEALFMLDKNGKVEYFAPYNKNYINNDMSSQNFFKNSAGSDKMYFSQVFMSQMNGAPAIVIVEPMKNNYLVAYFNLEFLSRIIRRFSLGQEIFAGIVDQKGELISFSDEVMAKQRYNISNLKIIQLGLQKKEKTLYEEYRNEMMLFSVAYIPTTGWVTFLFQSKENAFEIVSVTQMIFGAGFFLALFLAILLAVWSLKKILTPLSKLTIQSKKIADGQYNISTSDEEFEEFKTVLNDFQLMAKEIGKRENELKKSQKEIQHSLEEKDILLKEIHHRVKNNMQIILSLLYLQTSNIEDERIIKILQESQNRIKAMALIHEKLYQNNDLSKINFADYIQTLTHFLSRSYTPNLSLVDIQFDMEPLALSVDKAIYCGLIMNELLSNCFKYAFPNKREGVIIISLKNLYGNYISLGIKDNGVGLPESLDIRTTESLGLQLVVSLSEQLKAKLEISRTEGSGYVLIFVND
ncbi:MAG TPA: hypothetical protein DHW82_13390 [Spirochaetia bacterium]|nr:MAG: hypothetical protein A2Y41_07600 [Spirochaetes bacterium GWB1_36_13]HCL57983.1 hypothetical protein [Spirochaetia bacterium]